MTLTVFVDGGHGTTGLEIGERLAGRDDFRLLVLDEAERKSAEARREALRAADIAILCLPDEAAREAVRLAEGAGTRFIDASTAHRTAAGWTYGFAELEPGQRQRIAGADRVANVGCYAIGFIALVRPLVDAGVLSPNEALSVNAVSGYSGGGRAMIEEFESGSAATAFRNYALGLQHKHLPEMKHYARLRHLPLFSPSVADVHRGMIVEVPLTLGRIAGHATIAELRGTLEAAYATAGLVSVVSEEETAAMDMLPIERCAHSDRIDLFVFANPDSGQVRLAAALDNLGKGAAGSAVQNLNLMAGLDECAGLRL